MIKVKLSEHLPNDENISTDISAETADIDFLIDWVQGKPVPMLFPVKFLREYNTTNQYELKNKMIYGNPRLRTQLWFSFMFKQSDIDFLPIDYDVRNLGVSDDEAILIKEAIINAIKYTPELSEHTVLVYHSGSKSPQSGLHIIIKKEIDMTISKCLNLYGSILQDNCEYDLKLNDIKVLDSSLYNKKHFLRVYYGCGYEYLNVDAIEFNWTPPATGEPAKLLVPNVYTSSFFNELFRYLSRTSLTETELQQLYATEWNNTPFRSNGLTFGHELTRLLKYVKKQTNKNQYVDVFKLDAKGKLICDTQELYNYINRNYKFVYKDKDSLMYKSQDSNLWKVATYNGNQQTRMWDFTNNIFDELNIKNSIDKRRLIADGTNDVLRLIDKESIDIDRDLDTEDSIVYTLRTLSGIRLIKVTANNVELIDAELIEDTIVDIPINDIDLKYDYKNWDLYKIGFLQNITSDYNALEVIIGCSQHLNRTYMNSNRYQINTDAANKKEDISGTGKSILTLIQGNLRKTVFSDRRNDSQFGLSRLRHYHQMLIIDEMDCDVDLVDFRQFYSSNGLEVNAKYKDVQVIKPIKLIMNSNFYINKLKADEDRQITVAFERYYERTKNPLMKHTGYSVFKDDRLNRPNTQFTSDNGRLIDVNDWWNGYIAYMIHCCQQYLKNKHIHIVGIKNATKELQRQHEFFHNNKHDMYSILTENLEKELSKGNPTYSFTNQQLVGRFPNRSLGIVPDMITLYLKLYYPHYKLNSISNRNGTTHNIHK